MTPAPLRSRVPWPRAAANCSLLFTERPLPERPAAARAAGFDAVEFWWPFPHAVPGDHEVDAFVRAVTDAGVRLVGLNLPAGDLAGPDAGLLSLPGRRAEFRDGVAVAAAIGERLGVSVFNALYGNRVDGLAAPAQDELALDNLAFAAASVNGTVLLEPLSGPKPYPLRTAADAVAVVDRARAAGSANVGLLFDVYHLTVNGDDTTAALIAFADRVAHVQLADVPGRGAPGTGTIDFDRLHTTLRRVSYDGWVALECHAA